MFNMLFLLNIILIIFGAAFKITQSIFATTPTVLATLAT